MHRLKEIKRSTFSSNSITNFLHFRKAVTFTGVLLAMISFSSFLCSCSDNDEGAENSKPEDNQTESTVGTFAKGADVSWLTQMESEGLKFYDSNGNQKECMKLLKDDCGVNSIRLRVWVNPEGGWNNVSDVVVKAKRASNLGLRLMIDFHFSDTWADPGHQQMPKAWEGKDLQGVCQALQNHVKDVLGRLKALNITPEWVQVGNETTPGMMLPMGSIADNPKNYTAMNNAGYDAVKEVFPEAKVIVHLDAGHDQWIYNRMFDALESYGGRYDIIGMSVYPYWAEELGQAGGWRKIASDVITNVEHCRKKYNKPVMICEIGMPYDKPQDCKELIQMMMKANVEGIFYWEPQAPAGYNDGYSLGCFNDGKPTIALEPFKQ